MPGRLRLVCFTHWESNIAEHWKHYLSGAFGNLTDWMNNRNGMGGGDCYLHFSACLLKLAPAFRNTALFPCDSVKQYYEFWNCSIKSLHSLENSSKSRPTTEKKIRHKGVIMDEVTRWLRKFKDTKTSNFKTRYILNFIMWENRFHVIIQICYPI
jgi:hypothetical protein